MLCYSRLSARLSIVGGTVYVTTEEGLWGSPEESILFYQKVKEFPNRPPLAERWNSAVVKSVSFLDSVPDYFTSGEQSTLKTLEEKAKKLIS